MIGHQGALKRSLTEPVAGKDRIVVVHAAARHFMPRANPPLPMPPVQSPQGLTYRDAGVDIEAGDALVDRIKPFARRTMRPEVLAGIGGFGGLVEIGKRFRDPVLVAGTDGVGTKLMLAFALKRHDTVGIDLVAMSVNDILVQGAEPLFFLDYFATGKLDVDVAATVIKGIASGCETAGCALIGGETAEMPGMYAPGEYDLAGFAVGVVERDKIIDGRTIVAGDVVLGLASSGPHSNGFSLIRKIVATSGAELSSPFPSATSSSSSSSNTAATLGDALMAPTRIYVKPLLALLREMPVKGMAHITGGGLVENVPRMLPEGLQARLVASAWPQPPIFAWLQKHGNVADAEMHRVFNCGIGMALVVAAENEARALQFLADAGEQALRIGDIVAQPAGEPATVVT